MCWPKGIYWFFFYDHNSWMIISKNIECLREKYVSIIYTQFVRYLERSKASVLFMQTDILV